MRASLEATRCCKASQSLLAIFARVTNAGSRGWESTLNAAVKAGRPRTELTACAPLFKYGATMAGSLSWSGATLVLSGADLSAVGRGEYATAVWKSTNDGDDWTDETGDLVTISPGPAVWYEKDLYLVTRGEGVITGFEEDKAKDREGLLVKFDQPDRSGKTEHLYFAHSLHKLRVV